MKIYKQAWFWLMMIFIALLVLLFIFMAAFFPNIFCKIICKDWFWTAIGAVFTAFSAITALITYKNDVKIKSKQKTYEAVYQLKKDVYYIERKVGRLKVEEVDNLVKKKKQTNRKCCKWDDWECITKYLTKLEHFATCVNDGIFDFTTVKRMSGDYLIRQKKLLEPIINYKIRENKGMSTYKELLKMIDKLENIGG